MSLLYSILILHFIAQLTPGPDILLISKVAISKGRIPATFVILGITLGIAVWIILTLTGFSLVIQKWVWFQQVIMLFGAIFLAKMGWAMLSSFLKHHQQKVMQNVELENPQSIHQASNWAYFRQGFITNIINPKALVYFGSVFSIAVQSELLQSFQVIFALLIIIETFIVFFVLAWILSNDKIKPYYKKAEHYIDGLAGILFLGFAVWLLKEVIQIFLS